MKGNGTGHNKGRGAKELDAEMDATARGAVAALTFLPGPAGKMFRGIEIGFNALDELGNKNQNADPLQAAVDQANVARATQMQTLAKKVGVCFPAGTPVHTPAGLKAIEDILPGEKVWSYDHRLLKWTERQVVDVYRHDHCGPMATIQVNGETLRATGGHPVWVVRGEGLAERPAPSRISSYEAGGQQEGRWVLAYDLRANDEVLLRRGDVVALNSVCLDDVEEQVYNFKVDEFQNYAVGESGILVHNTNQLLGSKKVTTPNAAARAASQGKYIDPLTNNLVKTAETLAADHVFPKARIMKLPGFSKLSAEQQSTVLNNVGNFRGLPQSLNASKGSKIDWSTYKGQALSAEYAAALAKLQETMMNELQAQIKAILAGGK